MVLYDIFRYLSRCRCGRYVSLAFVVSNLKEHSDCEKRGELHHFVTKAGDDDKGVWIGHVFALLNRQGCGACPE